MFFGKSQRIKELEVENLILSERVELVERQRELDLKYKNREIAELREDIKLLIEGKIDVLQQKINANLGMESFSLEAKKREVASIYNGLLPNRSLFDRIYNSYCSPLSLLGY